LIGHNILYFGGGATNSNAVTVLNIGKSEHTTKNEEGEKSAEDEKCEESTEEEQKSPPLTLFRPHFLQPEGPSGPIIRPFVPKKAKKTAGSGSGGTSSSKTLDDDEGDDNENNLLRPCPLISTAAVQVRVGVS
jgi:hypothetical protein